MDSIKIKAQAKINIALEVIGKRDDGYHDLRMIMQSVCLHDDIVIAKTGKYPLKLTTNLNYLPCDERNLVFRAAKYLIDTFDIKDGVSIKLNKNIPVSAGLGGGSSDCAATLIGMRTLFGLDISDSELLTLGKTFGADVPYCLFGGCALAEGVGERLTKLKPHPDCFVVLVKPPVSVSTAAVFRDFRLSEVKKRGDLEKIIRFIDKKDLHRLAKSMFNDLESVTERRLSEITEIKRILMMYGALGSIMSGSGPTVFGFFETKFDAYRAIWEIKRTMPAIKDIFLSRIY